MNTEDLFEIKKKFLMTIPHPKLILKQILRLDPKFKHSALAIESSGLVPFLESHINAELEIKFAISNASTQEALLTALISLINLQDSLIKKLASYMDEITEGYPEIKMSEPFDVFAILKNLKSLSLKESEIKTYLCTALETNKSASKSLVCEAVIRAKKIENYGR